LDMRIPSKLSMDKDSFKHIDAFDGRTLLACLRWMDMPSLPEREGCAWLAWRILSNRRKILPLWIDQWQGSITASRMKEGRGSLVVIFS